MKNKTPFIAGAATLALIITGCSNGDEADSGTDEQTETVSFSTGIQFPPMGYVEDDELQGFDIDFGDELAERAGLQAEWNQSQFSQFISDVNSGRSDGILGAILDTPERQDDLTWIDYLETGYQFYTLQDVAEENSISDISDFCGLTVAASRNSTYAEDINAWSEENCGGDDITVLDTDGSPDALLQVRQGRAEGAMQTRETAIYQSQSDDDFVLIGDPITLDYYGLGIGIENEELLDDLTAAFEEMVDDGTYAEIAADWGLEDQAVSDVSINLEGRTTGLQ